MVENPFFAKISGCLCIARGQDKVTSPSAETFELTVKICKEAFLDGGLPNKFSHTCFVCFQAGVKGLLVGDFWQLCS